VSGQPLGVRRWDYQRCATQQAPTARVQALILENEERLESLRGDSQLMDTFYEVTIASVDQPKLLSRLSEALVRPVQNISAEKTCKS